MKKYIENITIYSILLIPIIGFHWKIVFANGVISGGDMINQFVPWREFALQELFQGRFPFWNPYVFCGTPFFSNIQTSLFYPFNILNLLFSVERTFSLSLVFHQCLSAVAMYIFLAHLCKNSGGAVIGALVYCWSGFFITHGYDGHLIHIRAYAFIPLVLYFQTIWKEKRHISSICWMAVCLSLMFFGGHTQIPLYIFYLVLFRSMWWAVEEWLLTRSLKGISVYFLPSFCGICLSIALAAVVLFPLYELSQYTAGRAGGADYSFATNDSMPPQNIVTLIAPYFYGDPTTSDLVNRFWITTTGYHEICGYTGVLSLLLMLFIFLPNRNLTENISASNGKNESYFFFVLCILSLFFALGRYNPLYPLLYYGLPGWSYFRVPGRLLLLFIIGVSVCSSFGYSRFSQFSFDDFIKTWIGKVSLIISVVFCIVLVIFIGSKPAILSMLREFEIDRTINEMKLWYTPRYQISQRLPESLFETRYAWMLYSSTISMIVLTLGWIVFGISSKQISTVKWVLPTIVILFDLLLFSSRFNNTIGADEWKSTHFPQTEFVNFLQKNVNEYRILCLDDAIGYPGIQSHPEIRPNRLMHYGVKTVRGYDPIILSSYTGLVNTIFGQPIETPQGGLLFFPSVPDRSYLNELNVKYIVTTQDISQSFPLVWSEEKSPVKIYENNTVYSRIFWQNFSSEDTLQITKNSPNQIAANISTDETKQIVFSDNVYNGWILNVDGKNQTFKLYRNTFPSIDIPSGKHTVKLEYSPWVNPYISSYYVGLLITIISLLLILFPVVTCFFGRYTKKV
jgi:hypothetical protein